MASVIKTKFNKVLFFIWDFAPSDDEMAAAQEIGPGVVFRNANFLPSNPSPGAIEACEAVYALDTSRIPKDYADKFPVWNAEQPGLFDADADKAKGKGKGKAAAAPQGGTEAPAVIGQPAAPASPATAPAAAPTGPNGTTPAGEPITTATATPTAAPTPAPGAGKGWSKNS